MILDVEDVLAVSAPEILGDGPLGVVRNQLRRRPFITDAFDPDVARVLVRLEEGDVAAVGRDLRARDLGVAEEKLSVEERSRLASLGGGEGWSTVRDDQRRQRDRPAIDDQPHIFLC